MRLSEASRSQLPVSRRPSRTWQAAASRPVSGSSSAAKSMPAKLRACPARRSHSASSFCACWRPSRTSRARPWWLPAGASRDASSRSVGMRVRLASSTYSCSARIQGASASSSSCCAWHCAARRAAQSRNAASAVSGRPASSALAAAATWRRHSDSPGKVSAARQRCGSSAPQTWATSARTPCAWCWTSSSTTCTAARMPSSARGPETGVSGSSSSPTASRRRPSASQPLSRVATYAGSTGARVALS